MYRNTFFISCYLSSVEAAESTFYMNEKNIEDDLINFEEKIVYWSLFFTIFEWIIHALRNGINQKRANHNLQMTVGWCQSFCY